MGTEIILIILEGFVPGHNGSDKEVKNNDAVVKGSALFHCKKCS